MRKLGWFAVWAVVAAMIASGVLLLVANLYVQSQGAQQRIRQTLTTALGVPVTLKKTTLTPWEGLRLDGIALQPALAPGTDAPASEALLTVESFSLRVAWWTLLAQRRLNVEAILLDHPRLVWAQNTEGRWVWPKEPVTADAPPPRHTGPERNAPPSVPPGPMADLSPAPPLPDSPRVALPVGQVGERFGTDPAPAASPAPDRVAAIVQKFRVRHGALNLLNAQRKLLGRFEEVDLDGQLRDAAHARGQLRVQRATHAPSGLFLTNFSSDFVYDGTDGLKIDHGFGELAGGQVHADYRLRAQENGSPFTAECRVEGVSLSELIKEAGSQLQLLEGRLQGAVNLEGFSDNPDRRRASGQLKLIGAEIKNFPVLQMFGEMLRIEDLSHLQFKQAELDCQLDGDDLQIAPLTLVSANLHILARGRYSTRNDQLDMHGRLTIDQAISHQLPEFIEMNFNPNPDGGVPGSRYIDFDVTGPLNKPTTNLLDRMLAGPTSGLLQNLLAPKPKKPRVKSPKPEPLAAPTAPAVDAKLPVPNPRLQPPKDHGAKPTDE